MPGAAAPVLEIGSVIPHKSASNAKSGLFVR
jgi:hypothetical protein